MTNIKSDPKTVLQRKKENNFSLFPFLSMCIMVIVGVSVLYPLFFVLMSSLKTNEDVIMRPFAITMPIFQNYIEAWQLGHVGSYFLNSVYVTVITVFVQVVMIVMAGYAFGKLKPPGYKIIFTAYLSAMLLTSEMTTVPIFVMMKKLGFYDTRIGLILPYIAGGLVIGTYICTNFIKALPPSLDEAAIIDGASAVDILLKIDIPMIMPAIATIVIFNFQGVWSEFFWALIMLKSDSIKTLPLGLINFQSQYSSNYGVLSAGLTILTIPLILVYINASNYFIRGLTTGAVKG